MDNQFAEIDKAVAGIGDYEVHDDYKSSALLQPSGLQCLRIKDREH